MVGELLAIALSQVDDGLLQSMDKADERNLEMQLRITFVLNVVDNLVIVSCSQHTLSHTVVSAHFLVDFPAVINGLVKARHVTITSAFTRIAVLISVVTVAVISSLLQCFEYT